MTPLAVSIAGAIASFVLVLVVLELIRSRRLRERYALLWLLTGLGRAFGHVEKEPGFYLRNGFFWIKMALFVSVVALEIWPMLTFIRWRIARRAGSRSRSSTGSPVSFWSMTCKRRWWS